MQQNTQTSIANDPQAWTNRIVRTQGVRHARFGWPVALVLFALVCLVAALAVLTWQERRAAAEVRQIVTELRDQGSPVDNATLEVWFAQHASAKGTAAWHEIIQLVKAQANQVDLPIVGNADLPDSLVPEGEWPEEQRVADYLQQVRPILSKLDAASEFPTPVWQPIQFNGFQTLLDPLIFSRSVARLAALEVEYAAYHGDAERAFRGLRLMKSVSDAFDWQNSAVSELVYLAIAQMHMHSVRRTLNVRLWDETDVDALIEQVGLPLDVQAHMRNTMSGERGMVLASLDEEGTGLLDVLRVEQAMGPATVLLRLPSTQLEYLRISERFVHLADHGLHQLSDAAAAIDRQTAESSNPLTFAFAPAVSAFANALLRHECQRRLTQMALAVRKYQLREGTWPPNASDLVRVGLDMTNCVDTDGTPFEYWVDEQSVSLRCLLPGFGGNDRNEAARIQVRIADSVRTSVSD